MGGPYGGQETPYLETEVLLAVMNDDESRAFDLLAGMTSSELREFGKQVNQLGHLIARHPR